MWTRYSVSIVGTVGVPGNYGGFETLAENLVRFRKEHDLDVELSVYCSSRAFESRPHEYLGAKLRFLPLNANGPQSIPYDVLSLLDAVRRRDDVIVLLGVSGALALPLVRLVSRARILTNIDGIEWKREKWRGLARMILRWSERVAVRWSHVVIADNSAIAEHVRERYRSGCEVIAYGGDHALAVEPVEDQSLDLPKEYALALCRIEPENNVSMILEAFSSMPERNLVFVGNWDKSDFGRDLRAHYHDHANIYMVDPIYDPGRLRWIRDGARAYIHGHSAGGTNPSLVEMMHFGIPVFAHACSFNRYTTEDQARYFESAAGLVAEVRGVDMTRLHEIGERMQEIAQRRYCWDQVGRAYFELVEAVCSKRWRIG
ncbi:Glycosyltransferase involved in cell wall bisynthesis [Marinobacter daqiaonensis]|uniref:Glycosyltransferase involved in cell wall bisynthesis n=1 Tax=Marinobacter daqiaonensis TaxID=650891 RepID=A0A1I6H9B4_9GAMM|nr:DUF1972 domain-containing protein [Marinobacter daqiaonensis]SFR50968.1 Glycosyltransferase involved in cell wall bisynthesis [Marinobacter daqiaonensis]